MSPTVFRVKNWRFFFFANEEPRIHIHIVSPNGEAKFWISPVVALAMNSGFSKKELLEIQKIVEARKDEIKKTWDQFFTQKT